jgi:protein involved in polysaccharide export with SLBB domain
MKKIACILLLLAAIGTMSLTVRAQQNNSGLVVVERIYVIGNVANPQQVLFSPTLTLTRALAWVGGVLTDTDMKRVKINRVNGTQEGATLFVNLKAIRDGKAKDFILQPYDIVCVPNKKSKGANCYGYVRRPTPELPSRVIQ